MWFIIILSINNIIYPCILSFDMVEYLLLDTYWEVKLLANIKSAKKRIELTKNKTLINKAKKTEIKTYIKKFETALNEGNLDEAQVLIKAIDKKLKRAAQRNIIHDNAVARKMSHLTKRLNKAM